MERSKYEKIVHLLSIGVALTFWYISFQFSVDGFGFVFPKYKIFGYLLAICETGAEIVFLEEGTQHRLTMMVVGGLAYLYDIVTNLIGVTLAETGTSNLPDPTANFLGFMIIWVLALVLAAAPEPFFMWGILGTEDMRDPLEGVVNKFGEDTPGNKRRLQFGKPEDKGRANFGS